jgi:cholesterol transport system auxiliary component
MMAGGDNAGQGQVKRERQAVRPGSRLATRLAATTLMGALLVGCAAIIPQAASAIYDLTAPEGFTSPAARSVQILIPVPATIKALDTERIAARPAAGEYAYLPNAVWSDQLPRLLQTRLMQTFQNSGKVRAAALPGQGVLIDYQVVLDIRAFELAGNGAMAEFAVKLMDDRNGRVLESKVVRQFVEVPSLDTPAIVAALDQAMDAAYLEIVTWSLQRL